MVDVFIYECILYGKKTNILTFTNAGISCTHIIVLWPKASSFTNAYIVGKLIYLKRTITYPSETSIIFRQLSSHLLPPSPLVPLLVCMSGRRSFVRMSLAPT